MLFSFTPKIRWGKKEHIIIYKSQNKLWEQEDCTNYLDNPDF